MEPTPTAPTPEQQKKAVMRAVKEADRTLRAMTMPQGRVRRGKHLPGDTKTTVQAKRPKNRSRDKQAKQSRRRNR